jgi:hypothetical protein
MELGRTPRGKIRGWSVSQTAGRRHTHAAGPSIFEAIGARRGLLVHLGVLGLTLWAAGVLLLGDKGVLRLRALRQEETAMASENALLRQQVKETEFELKEHPGLGMERVMRERYGKSLPNEIVYQKVLVHPDTAAVSPETGPKEMGH